MLTEWLLLGLGVLLTLATGVFVAAEFSLITVDRSAVEKAVSDGEKGAPAVLGALKTLSTQLSGAQVGITITTLIVGFLVEPSLAGLLLGPLDAVGVPQSYVGPVAVGLGMAIATFASMLIGELIPKNLALSLPMATAKAVVPAQRAFTWAATPLITALNKTANRILGWVGVEPQEELSGGRTPEELVSLVRRSAEVGTLDQGTANLLTRTLALSEHTASDVMTPRVRLQTLHPHDSLAEVLTLSRRTGHSRFPVVEGDLDDVIGVVHVKHAVAVPFAEREHRQVVQVMQPTRTVPETMRLNPLLALLRAKGLQLAVVVDEYGGTAGVVTLEDLIEEIVGEVADEHEPSDVRLRRLREGAWSMPGQIRPDELRGAAGIDVPDSPHYETVGGFVLSELGRLAEPGDRVAVPGGELVVSRMDGWRIDRIRFAPARGEKSADE